MKATGLMPSGDGTSAGRKVARPTQSPGVGAPGAARPARTPDVERPARTPDVERPPRTPAPRAQLGHPMSSARLGRWRRAQRSKSSAHLRCPGVVRLALDTRGRAPGVVRQA